MNMYQTVIENLRRGYPELPWNTTKTAADAVTMYPNVAAELLNAGIHYDSVCRQANFSEDILVAVMEDGEPLEHSEIIKLCRLWECKLGYITSNKLQIINPATNKGKCKLWELESLYNLLDLKGVEYYKAYQNESRTKSDTDGIAYSYIMEYCESRIERLLASIHDRKTVTYAWYRHVMDNAKWAMQTKQNYKQRKPRRERLRLNDGKH